MTAKTEEKPISKREQAEETVPILLKSIITPQPLGRVESAGRRRFRCYKVPTQE